MGKGRGRGRGTGADKGCEVIPISEDQVCRIVFQRAISTMLSFLHSCGLGVPDDNGWNISMRLCILTRFLISLWSLRRIVLGTVPHVLELCVSVRLDVLHININLY